MQPARDEQDAAAPVSPAAGQARAVSDDAPESGEAPNSPALQGSPPEHLGDQLVRISPRERAGPRSANRLEYQRHWALVELLGRHERGEDYCVVFEYHDDVLFLDCEDIPTGAEFFQVKTHDRDWTIGALVTRRRLADLRADAGQAPPSSQPAAPDLSIIGKLYDNWLKHGNATRALTLVSNRSVGPSCQLRPGTSRNRFCATGLADREWQKLVEAIRAEHGTDVSPDGLRLLHVVRTEIPVAEARAAAYSLGELTFFLERRFPGRRPPAAALHSTLMSQMARLNTYEGTHGSYTDLLERQGLSRRQFEAMVVRAGQTDDLEAAWQNVRAQLDREQRWSFMRLQRLHEAWRDYLLDRMDSTNAPIQRQRRRLRHALARWREADYDGPLTDLIESVQAVIGRGEDAVPATGQSELYVAAMILLELVTREPDDDAVQAARPRPPQEAA